MRDFAAAFERDYVVLGGGNAKLVKEPPRDTRLGDNDNAFVGGFRLGHRPSWGRRGFEWIREIADAEPRGGPRMSRSDQGERR